MVEFFQHAVQLSVYPFGDADTEDVSHFVGAQANSPISQECSNILWRGRAPVFRFSVFQEPRVDFWLSGFSQRPQPVSPAASSRRGKSNGVPEDRADQALKTHE